MRRQRAHGSDGFRCWSGGGLSKCEGRRGPSSRAKIIETKTTLFQTNTPYQMMLLAHEMRPKTASCSPSGSFTSGSTELSHNTSSVSMQLARASEKKHNGERRAESHRKHKRQSNETRQSSCAETVLAMTGHRAQEQQQQERHRRRHQHALSPLPPPPRRRHRCRAQPPSCRVEPPRGKTHAVR